MLLERNMNPARYPWKMEIYVRGHYCGADYFKRKRAADDECRDRRRRLAVLGCTYRVRPNLPDKPPPLLRDLRASA